MYEKLGFKFLHDTHPNYWWVKDNLIYSRYKTMKSNLDKILGDKFDINKTEYENMTANGFYQLFDWKFRLLFFSYFPSRGLKVRRFCLNHLPKKSLSF